MGDKNDRLPVMPGRFICFFRNEPTEPKVRPDVRCQSGGGKDRIVANEVVYISRLSKSPAVLAERSQIL